MTETHAAVGEFIKLCAGVGAVPVLWVLTWDLFKALSR